MKKPPKKGPGEPIATPISQREPTQSSISNFPPSHKSKYRYMFLHERRLSHCLRRHRGRDRIAVRVIDRGLSRCLPRLCGWPPTQPGIAPRTCRDRAARLSGRAGGIQHRTRIEHVPDVHYLLYWQLEADRQSLLLGECRPLHYVLRQHACSMPCLLCVLHHHSLPLHTPRRIKPRR